MLSSAAIAVAILTAAGNPVETPAARVRALIDVLGSDAAPDAKQKASDEIVAAGVVAIPVLIDARSDARAFAVRDIANRMNLPPNAKQPPPLLSTTTVGMRAEELLFAIITPPPTKMSNIKVFSEQTLRVTDWPAWWAAHAHSTLAQIHAELLPLVDTYWEKHGTTQVVPLTAPKVMSAPPPRER